MIINDSFGIKHYPLISLGIRVFLASVLVIVNNFVTFSTTSEYCKYRQYRIPTELIKKGKKNKGGTTNRSQIDTRQIPFLNYVIIIKK